jgi:hypothetical protein
VPAQRRGERAERAERAAVAAQRARRSQRPLGTVGQRPPSVFGGFPVSEIAIFAGLVAIIVWMARGGAPVLVVGLVLCACGVVEVTAREHFSGYRSHTTLLAAIPAVTISIGLLTALGTHSGRAPLLVLVGVPIFSALFWFLRKRFLIARQARVARPPEP